MKIAFVLLAHESPDALRPLIETLLASGSDVYVHHDANSSHELQRSAEAWQLERFEGRLLHAERVKVAWGEWSIVQATLNCLRLARQRGYDADYFMLISGSCMPIKPIRLLEGHLKDLGGLDFIEVVNAQEKRWITRGIQQERWEKYHYINWRNHPKLFDLSLKWQKKLKIQRRLPLQHTPFMGSQWWCLRATTIDAVLKLLDRHSELEVFYRRTWVPDELFFQTMVGNLIAPDEISPEILTRYKFNSWGIPRVYYEDDLPELLAESTFFARKISHRAPRLKQALSELCRLPEREYRRSLRDSDNVHAAELRSKIALAREISGIAWFGLMTARENKFDYLKAIPNQIIVIVSEDAETRKRALDEMRAHPEMVVYGDLFGGERLEYGGDIKAAAGYWHESVKLASYRWHLFLGELAFHAQGKPMVFALGDEPLPYLEVLRWKANLTVILLDKDEASTPEQIDFPALYAKSQVSQLVRKDAHCRYARLPFALFREITCTGRAIGTNTDEYLARLVNTSVGQGWPILYPRADDRDEINKYLPHPILLVISADIGMGNEVLWQLAQREDVAIFENALAAVPPESEDDGWQSYLGDLARMAGKKIAAINLSLEHGSYLDALRWKKDLAVLMVKSPAEEKGSSLDELEGAKQLEDASNRALRKIERLMQDRYCEAYCVTPGDAEGIDGVVDAFWEHCKQLKVRADGDALAAL